MALEEYRKKRDFSETTEPAPKVERSADGPRFVVQEHHATRLHWDLRLEVDGVLKSWAVTKMPVMDTRIKRLAVQTEDHPLKYLTFHGEIPEGNYGAGHMEVWDTGRYEPLGDFKRGLHTGKIEFALHGKKLTGMFAMVRAHFGGRGTSTRGGGKQNWLLIKMKEKALPAKTASGRRGGTRRGEDGWKRPTEGGGRRGGRTKGSAAGKGRLQSVGRIVREGEPERIEPSSTQKVMFPAATPLSGRGKGATKGDLLGYYERIAPVLLPHLRDRPITVERLPDGLVGEKPPHFWQKNTPKHFPGWVPRIGLLSDNRRGETAVVEYAVVNDLETLLYMVNQNAVTFHVFFSRAESLDRPDFVLFDVDPHQSTFGNALKVAQAIHELLAGTKTNAFVKTSGKSGLHVLVKWEKPGGYDEARAWATTVAQDVVRDLPRIATTERLIQARGERVYVDVVQNARGHHAVPPYVVRATDLATVSTPLTWREVRAGLDPRSFTMDEVLRRVKRMGDLMEPLGAGAAG